MSAQQTSWLIEMAGQGYLTVGDKPAWGFCWTGEPRKALHFTSQEQAEAAMESIRRYVPALFPDCLLKPPCPVERVLEAQEPRKASGNQVHEKQTDRPAAPTPSPKSGSLVSPPTSVSPQASPDSPFPSPLIEEVEVETEVGTGKNAHLELLPMMQIEGTVLSVSPVQVSAKKSQFIAVEIAGLPNEPESKTITPHAQFHCFHKSLFEALQTAKPGKSRITLQYKITTVATDPKKLIWQNIEGVSSVDGVEYVEGKPVK